MLALWRGQSMSHPTKDACAAHPCVSGLARKQCKAMTAHKNCASTWDTPMKGGVWNGRAPHASGWALRAPCPRPCRRPLWMDPPQTASRAPRRSLAAAPLPSGKQLPAMRSPLIKRAHAQATRMLSQPVRTTPVSQQAYFCRSWLGKAALHGSSSFSRTLQPSLQHRHRQQRIIYTQQCPCICWGSALAALGRHPAAACSLHQGARRSANAADTHKLQGFTCTAVPVHLLGRCSDSLGKASCSSSSSAAFMVNSHSLTGWMKRAPGGICAGAICCAPGPFRAASLEPSPS
jgi:hypothetical protein